MSRVPKTTFDDCLTRLGQAYFFYYNYKNAIIPQEKFHYLTAALFFTRSVVHFYINSLNKLKKIPEIAKWLYGNPTYSDKKKLTNDEHLTALMNLRNDIIKESILTPSILFDPSPAEKNKAIFEYEFVTDNKIKITSKDPHTKQIISERVTYYNLSYKVDGEQLYPNIIVANGLAEFNEIFHIFELLTTKVDVVDEKCNTISTESLKTIQEQGLLHRCVHIIIGNGDKYLLRKSNPHYCGKYLLPTTTGYFTETRKSQLVANDAIKEILPNKDIELIRKYYGIYQDEWPGNTKKIITVYEGHIDINEKIGSYLRRRTFF